VNRRDAMTAGTLYRSPAPARAGHDGFAHLVHAEWTKFRTVRGWVAGMIVAGLMVVGVGLLGHSQCGGIVNGVTTNGGPSRTNPLGPGGEAVMDSFYFVHQPLAGNGTITVRVSLMTGSSSPWSKPGMSAAGIRKPPTRCRRCRWTCATGCGTGRLARPTDPSEREERRPADRADCHISGYAADCWLSMAGAKPVSAA
jgi:hypothetical protein